jgi:hypothetical protein
LYLGLFDFNCDSMAVSVICSISAGKRAAGKRPALKFAHSLKNFDWRLKMNIKSLLIGSAAALAAVSGAQAADAIVAAEPEPMEYVRVCDAFGKGFFYMPGTETCLKFDGYVRFQTDFGRRKAGDSDWDSFTRAQFNIDTRTDTELGALRGYIGFRGDADQDSSRGVVVDQAFIELSGLKVGFYYNWWDDGLAGEYDQLSSNKTRLNAVRYTYDAGSFYAGVAVEELEGVIAGNDADIAATVTSGRVSGGYTAINKKNNLGVAQGNWTTANGKSATDNNVGISAIIGGKFGAVKANILGGYDTNAENGAIRAIVTADLGPGTFGLAGAWASGANAYYCQRRSKSRPRGGAKVGHYGAGLRPPGGRSPSGGLRPARHFFRSVSTGLSGAALSETIAVAVHLEDVDMVGDAIEQCAGQTFGSQGFRPFIKREIAGDHSGAALVALRDQLEQQFGAGLGQRHEAQFIDDQQLVGGHLLLESEKTPLITRLHHLADQRGRRGEAHGQALLASCQAKAERDMCFARAAGTERNDILPPLDPFASCQFQHLHLVELGDGGEVEAVEAFDDGEFRRLDAALDLAAIAFDHLPLAKSEEVSDMIDALGGA